MPTDLSPMLLERYRTKSIGFVFIDNRPKPVAGSGVLLKFKHLWGILTCTHVAKLFVKHAQVGIVSFRRFEQSQSQRLNVVADNFIMLSDDTIGKEAEAIDLCFIRLDASQITDFTARFSFVDFERDLQKISKYEPTSLLREEAVFGPIAENTGVQTKHNHSVTTPLQGVLSPGNIVETNKNFSIFQCKAYNTADLPLEFGGNSGAGLWRAYLRKHDDETIEIVDDVLSGIASYQLPDTVPTRLLCQGVGRILLVLDEAQKRWPAP